MDTPDKNLFQDHLSFCTLPINESSPRFISRRWSVENENLMLMGWLTNGYGCEVSSSCMYFFLFFGKQVNQSSTRLQTCTTLHRNVTISITKYFRLWSSLGAVYIAIYPHIVYRSAPMAARHSSEGSKEPNLSFNSCLSFGVHDIRPDVPPRHGAVPILVKYVNHKVFIEPNTNGAPAGVSLRLLWMRNMENNMYLRHIEFLWMCTFLISSLEASHIFKT